ncbi:MAG: hypothetical protein M3457_08650, partial [Chloroflexota bacterium]|nr:hypothetical protein [Chloroflexota bacterium]
ANKLLTAVVNQVTTGQMDQVIPDELSWRKGITLRDAMNVGAYENKCVPEVLAGAGKLPSNDEFMEDLLGDDPLGNYNRYSTVANTAALELDDPDRTVHISYGDFPARDYLRDITINRSLGAHDIATFIGVDARFSDELTQGMWDAISPIAEYLRDIGVFGPRIEVAEDAPLQERLLGLTGRRPSE